MTIRSVTEEVTEVDKNKESQTEEQPDFSLEIPCIICRLSALEQLMMHDDRTHDGLSGADLNGLGLLLGDIARRLEKVNEGLYGKD